MKKLHATLGVNAKQSQRSALKTRDSFDGYSSIHVFSASAQQS